ncbi:MAG: DNRLRE domain-containing protein [Bacteroidota bacterium]
MSLQLAYSQVITVTLTCNKDAAIGYHDGASTANNNYGNATQNAAFAIPSSFSSGLNVNRALIGFNLSTIPANASIISAALNLYALGPYGTLPGHTGSANSSYIRRVIQPWNEYTVTWNNQPSTTILNQVTLAQSLSSNQDYTNIPVTNLVIDMINNPTTSDGFMLQLINESPSNALLFASKDNGNSNLIPTLVISYSVPCTSQTDTLLPDYDAAIGYHDGNPSAANSNYGNASQCAAFAIPSAFGPGLNVNRGLLHFDLSNIPTGAVITSAEIDLYSIVNMGSYPAHSGTNNNAYIKRVTSPWTEYSVTWNNQPSTTSSNQVILTGTNNQYQDYLGINVLNLVNDIINSGNNYGFMLGLVNETATNLLSFCSKDYSNPSKRPRLRISYTCNETTITNVDSKSIFVFPNPASDIININKYSDEQAKVTISFIDGEKILETEINNNSSEISVSNLSCGIYFIHIYNKLNELIFTNKIVIIK